jgi:hypothetical protein
MIIFDSGHTLTKLFHLRRQIPPIKKVKASRLVLGQLFLPPFKVRLLHEPNELVSTQNLVKL